MTVAAFRVCKSASQIITPPVPLNYVDVTWNTIMFDQTGWFDPITGTWRPQASGLADMKWQVWNQAGVYNSQGYGLTAKLIGKDVNGVTKTANGINQDMAAVGTLGSYPNTGQSAFCMVVQVDAGDVWKIANYVQPASGAGGSVTIDGNPAHTSWGCTFFPAGS